jgi:hypothetical protein
MVPGLRADEAFAYSKQDGKSCCVKVMAKHAGPNFHDLITQPTMGGRSWSGRQTITRS